MFEVVIDTSSLATDLVSWYARRGYTEIDRWKWDAPNCISVVLRKDLACPGVS
jgi:hypothetical protein